LADFYVGPGPRSRPTRSGTRPTGSSIAVQALWHGAAIAITTCWSSEEIHAEKSGVAPRPEPEIARPEVEIAPVAGSSSDRDVVVTTGSPMIDSSGEAVEALSEYPFPARQEPEIAPEPFHPLKPMQQPRFFTRMSLHEI